MDHTSRSSRMLAHPSQRNHHLSPHMRIHPGRWDRLAPVAGVTCVLMIAGAGVLLAFTGTSRPEREKAPAFDQVTPLTRRPGVLQTPSGSPSPPPPGPAAPAGQAGAQAVPPSVLPSGRRSGWRQRMAPPPAARPVPGLRKPRPATTGLPPLPLVGVRPEPAIPHPADTAQRRTDIGRRPAGTVSRPTGPGRGRTNTDPSTASGSADAARRGGPARRSGPEHPVGGRPSLTPPPGDIAPDRRAGPPGPPAPVGANPCATFHDLRRQYCERLLGG